MADITATATTVGVLFPDKAEIYSMIAVETITKGQPVYQTTAGKAGVADANAAGKQQFRGVALTGGGAGTAISVLRRGFVGGYDLSNVAYDGYVYLSDTAGSFADAAGTLEVRCGRVYGLTDSAITKALFIDVNELSTWA